MQTQLESTSAMTDDADPEFDGLLTMTTCNTIGEAANPVTIEGMLKAQACVLQLNRRNTQPAYTPMVPLVPTVAKSQYLSDMSLRHRISGGLPILPYDYGINIMVELRPRFATLRHKLFLATIGRKHDSLHHTDNSQSTQ